MGVDGDIFACIGKCLEFAFDFGSAMNLDGLVTIYFVNYSMIISSVRNPDFEDDFFQ